MYSKNNVFLPDEQIGLVSLTLSTFNSFRPQLCSIPLKHRINGQNNGVVLKLRVFHIPADIKKISQQVEHLKELFDEKSNVKKFIKSKLYNFVHLNTGNLRQTQLNIPLFSDKSQLA